MPAKNDITGDPIVTKNNSEAYRDNWDKIFKKDVEEKETEQKLDDDKTE